MEIGSYLEKMVKVNKLFLEWLDEENNETKYNIDQFNQLNIQSNREKFKLTLRLLSKIAKCHYRKPLFFSKIRSFLTTYKEDIQNFLSNDEIFKLFKGNKAILLILIQNKIISIDDQIINTIKQPKYSIFKYIDYLYPEIKELIELKDDQIELNFNDIENFYQNREIGENENYICKLIREDSIKEFVVFVNRTNFNLNTEIETSTYETNSFLIKNKPTLIEYSAFFGSIQIIRYLCFNKIELKPSLWIYAIHGRNPELIHFLEENQIKPYDDTYNKCLIESIRCHHFELIQYFENNFCKKNKNFDVDSQSLKYFNFLYFPKDLSSDNVFYYLCKYDYITLVKILLNQSNLNINVKIVLLKKYFL